MIEVYLAAAADVWGCPYHGCVEDGFLTLSNAETVEWPQYFSNGWTYPIRVPGMPAVTRSPAEQADDDARGFEWRNDAIFSAKLSLYGRVTGGGSDWDFIYIDSLKRPWSVTTETGITVDAGEIVGELIFKRIFRFQAYPEAGTQPAVHTVALDTIADYGDDEATMSGAILADVAVNGQALAVLTTCGEDNLYSVIRFDITDDSAADEQDLVITVTPTLVAAQSACIGTIDYQATQAPPGYAKYEQILSVGSHTDNDTGTTGPCTPPGTVHEHENIINTPIDDALQVVDAKETWVEVVGRVRHAWFDQAGDLHLVKMDFYWYDFYDSYADITWPSPQASTTWDQCTGVGGGTPFNVIYTEEAIRNRTVYTGHWTTFNTRIYDDVNEVAVDSELQFYQDQTTETRWRVEAGFPWGFPLPPITQTSNTDGPLTKHATWVIGGEEQDLSHLSESTIDAIIAVNTTLHGTRIANVNTLWPSVLDSYDVHPTQKGSGQPDNPTERVQVFRRTNNLAHWCWSRRARSSPSLAALTRYAAVMLTPDGVDSEPELTDFADFEAPALYYSYNPNTGEVRRDTTFPVCWV